MKPPKSVRKAVLSFLGGKKKEFPIDASQRVIEDRSSHCSSAMRYSSNFADKRRMQSHSGLGGRSVSLPSSTRKRIEEWNQQVSPEFDPEIEDGMKRTISATSRRSQEIRNLKHPTGARSSQSVSSYNTRGSHTRSLESREITPWDSVSRASSRVEPMSQRDSGTFDHYVNEEITASEVYPSFDIARPHPSFSLKRYNSDSHIYRNPQPISRTLPGRTASFSCQPPGTLGPRTTRRSSNVSEKLLNCMGTLEHLSRRLNDVTMISSEVEKFQEAADGITTRKQNRSRISQRDSIVTRNPVEWSIGNESISYSDPVYQNSGRGRTRSYESSSTDSGINFNLEPGSKNKFYNPLFRPRSTVSTNPRVDGFESSIQGMKSQRTNKHASLHPDNVISGYSNNNGENQKRQVAPLDYYPQLHPASSIQSGYSSRYPSINPIYPNTGIKQYPEYGYDQEGGNEDPYGYGSFRYASSSVYEEDLNQNNGWFYLPNALQPSQAIHQAPVSQYSHHTDYPSHTPYYPEIMAYQTQHPFYQSQIGSNVMGSQTWSENYGALSESFLNPNLGVSPLTAAISATSVEDLTPIVTSESTDLNKFGSFRYCNGERTTIVPQSGDSRRRKTVRFSRTVKQRVETDESEMEDSTSVIKGGERTESDYISPCSNQITPPSDPNIQQLKNTISEHTIYEFPSGHIESSCMCADCILARGSSQLQPTSSFAYY